MNRMKRMRLAASIAFVGVFLLLSGAAYADVIYNSIDFQNDSQNDFQNIFADSVAQYGPLADSFSTGSMPVTLADIQLLLAVPPTIECTVYVGLFADNSTSPGTFLSSIGTVTDEYLNNPQAGGVTAEAPYSPSGNDTGYELALVDFQLGNGLNYSGGSDNMSKFEVGNPVLLDANTRYWIELSSDDNSLAMWAEALDANGVGVSGEYNYGEGVFSNSEYPPYEMEVTVPEPITLLLLGCSFAGLALGKRRFEK